MTVLHRVVVNLIDMARQVLIDPDQVFPETPLPDSALSSVDS
jgi:hypothetical protein